MEPTDARKAFICFDEPDMKARFSIRVIHDSSLHVLSNMPVKSSNYLWVFRLRFSFPFHSIQIFFYRSIYGDYNWTQTDFHETVEMSTYLVAIIISDFKCLSSVANLKDSRQVRVGVCARPNAIEQAELALNVSVKSLEFFESYFNVKYPLPKLDHIAIPDFTSGGYITLFKS